MKRLLPILLFALCPLLTYAEDSIYQEWKKLSVVNWLPGESQCYDYLDMTDATTQGLVSTYGEYVVLGDSIPEFSTPSSYTKTFTVDPNHSILSIYLAPDFGPKHQSTCGQEDSIKARISIIIDQEVLISDVLQEYSQVYTQHFYYDLEGKTNFTITIKVNDCAADFHYVCCKMAIGCLDSMPYPQITKHYCEGDSMLTLSVNSDFYPMDPHIFWANVNTPQLVYKIGNTAKVPINQGENYIYFWKVHGVFINDTIFSGTASDNIADALHCPVYEIWDTSYIYSRAEPTVWNNRVLIGPGDMSDTLATIYGCDSVVYKHVKLVQSIYEKDTACGNSYYWRGKVYTESGHYLSEQKYGLVEDTIYHLLLTMAHGEDFYNLTIDSVCRDSIYIWRTRPITQPGYYTDSFINQYGCDSVYALQLTVIKCDPHEWQDGNPLNPTILCDTAYSALDTTIYCDSILWFEKWYYTSGTYHDTLKNVTSTFCDSIGTLVLKVLDTSTATDTTAYTCYGVPFVWHGKEAVDGDTIRRKNAQGCDSIVTLRLFVSEAPVTIPLKDTASCQLVPFLWRGHQIVSDTLCYDTIRTTKLGCDSIYASLRFVVKEPSASDTTAYTCYGVPFIWHGKTAQDGDTIMRKNAQGCDSVVTLHLITNPTYNQEVNLTICDKQLPYTWNGIKCETAGDYVLDSATVLGCDSVVTLHLSVDTYSASDTSAYICFYDQPYSWHGRIAQDGDTIMRKNAAGCDSIVTLHLYTSAEPVTLQQKDTASCQLVLFLWRGHQIVSDTLCYDTLRTTKLGCDSIYASLRFVVKEPSRSDTSAYVCYEDLPFIWHGKEAKDGDTIMLINRAGCDSIVTLRLTTSTKPIVWNIDTTICDTLLPFKWREYTFTAIYTYRDTIYNARGCDSIYRSFTLDTVHCVRPEPPVPPVDTCVSNLVYRKWVDFIFCDNGRDEFVAFQWFRNNLSIAGETGQYLYLPGTMGAAEYFVEATKTDGTKIRTCPLIFDNTPRSRDTYVNVQTVIRRGEPLQIEMSDPEADVVLYTVVGQSVLSAHILGPETSLPITLPAGTYVLRLIGANVNTTTKILIE